MRCLDVSNASPPHPLSSFVSLPPLQENGASVSAVNATPNVNGAVQTRDVEEQFVGPGI
jgi:hypothetical protein